MIAPKWIGVCVALVCASLLGGYGVRAAGLGDSSASLSSHLYDGWRGQMGIVAYTASPRLPTGLASRLRQVWGIEAQNQRAAGMVSMMHQVHGGQELGTLADELAGINGEIDQILSHMSTGYTGQARSRASAADIRFVRTLVQHSILDRLPTSLASDSDVQRVHQALRSLDAYMLHQLNTRFVKH